MTTKPKFICGFASVIWLAVIAGSGHTLPGISYKAGLFSSSHGLTCTKPSASRIYSKAELPGALVLRLLGGGMQKKGKVTRRKHSNDKVSKRSHTNVFKDAGRLESSSKKKWKGHSRGARGKHRRRQKGGNEQDSGESRAKQSGNDKTERLSHGGNRTDDDASEVKDSSSADEEGKRASPTEGQTAEDIMLEKMRKRTVSTWSVAPMYAKSTFSGIFEISPAVPLPGHQGLTLEHFRTERTDTDQEGQALEDGLYRWRDRLVRVTMDKEGNKQALMDVKSGKELYKYTGKTPVYLSGHKDIFLEDFPLERIPTETMGVYKWRDRVVRVIFAEGRPERIIDNDDGSVVYIFESDDRQNALDADMFNELMYMFDRPAALARASHQAEIASKEGVAFGEIRIMWPQDTDEGIEHGGTIIWLHEMGSNCHESEAIARRLEMPWIKYIFPTAPLQSVTLLGGNTTTSWFDVTSLTDEKSVEDQEGIDFSTNYITCLIEDEVLRGVPPSKIAVVGIGQGGVVAMNAALRGYRWEDVEENTIESERLACLVGLSTWVPNSMKKLRPFWFEELLPTYWKGEKVGMRGGLPTLLCHGMQDTFVPFQLGRKSYKKAERMGFSVQFSRYEMGHGLCEQELHDIQFFISRMHLPDPIIRLDIAMGPGQPLWAAEHIKETLREAGLKEDMVDEDGWVVQEGEEEEDKEGDLMSEEDSENKVVNVIGPGMQF